MVEQVEELEPHLKVKSLREVCVLVNRCIRLHECRVTELPGLLVALSAASGRSELPCGEDTGEVCPARGGLLIAGHVREVSVISIGIVITAR